MSNLLTDILTEIGQISADAVADMLTFFNAPKKAEKGKKGQVVAGPPTPRPSRGMTGPNMIAFGRYKSGKVGWNPNDIEALNRNKLVDGASRMGKTTLAMQVLLQFIERGYGAAYLDNADGEAVANLVKCIPEKHMHRLVYADHSNPRFPIGVPLLEIAKDDPFAAETLTELWMGFFINQFGLADLWQTQDLMRAACQLALTDPEATLLEVKQVCVDMEYRLKCLVRANNRDLWAWWKRFDGYTDAQRDQIIKPFLTRANNLLSSQRLKQVVAQRPKRNDEGDFFLNYRRLMDEGKIILVRAPETGVGAAAAIFTRMVMSLHLTKLWAAALSREDIPKDKRRPFLLICDEPQTWLTGNEDLLANMYAKSGKYRLSVMSLVQSTHQLKIEELIRVIMANRPDLFLFASDEKEAKLFDSELRPYYSSDDVVNLPKYNFIAKPFGQQPLKCRSLGIPMVVGERENISDDFTKMLGAPYTEVADDIFNRENPSYDGGPTWEESKNTSEEKPPRRKR